MDLFICGFALVLVFLLGFVAALELIDYVGDENE